MKERGCLGHPVIGEGKILMKMMCKGLYQGKDQWETLGSSVMNI
jgi:hypothetical protein